VWVAAFTELAVAIKYMQDIGFEFEKHFQWLNDVQDHSKS